MPMDLWIDRVPSLLPSYRSTDVRCRDMGPSETGTVQAQSIIRRERNTGVPEDRSGHHLCLILPTLSQNSIPSRRWPLWSPSYNDGVGKRTTKVIVLPLQVRKEISSTAQDQQMNGLGIATERDRQNGKSGQPNVLLVPKWCEDQSSPVGASRVADSTLTFRRKLFGPKGFSCLIGALGLSPLPKRGPCVGPFQALGPFFSLSLSLFFSHE